MFKLFLNMDWSKFEEIIGETLPICLKKILNLAAYDNINSLKCLDKERISEIEQYVSDYGLSVIDKLDCCHSDKYKNKKQFKFLPGHRSILLTIPNHAQRFSDIFISQKPVQNIESLSAKNNEVSTILAELNATAQANSKKSKNQASYSDTNRYFSTYVYLNCGRSCYETLHRNLPIPSAKTICK